MVYGLRGKKTKKIPVQFQTGYFNPVSFRRSQGGISMPSNILIPAGKINVYRWRHEAYSYANAKALDASSAKGEYPEQDGVVTGCLAGK